MHAKQANADTQRPDSGFSARTAHGGSTVSAQDYALLVNLALGVLRLHRQFELRITHLSHAYTPFHSSVGILTVENYVRIIKTHSFQFHTMLLTRKANPFETAAVIRP